MNAKVRLYVATSLDGFVAGPDHGLDWLFTDGDYGFKAFYGAVGGLVMGRKTYDVVRGFGEWPYTDRPCWVFSRRPAVAHAGVRFVAGRPSDLIDEIAEEAGGPIWLVGGGEITAEFMVAGLVDELILSIHPIILGDGVRLFHRGIPRMDLELVNSETWASGLVQLTYARKDPAPVPA